MKNQELAAPADVREKLAEAFRDVERLPIPVLVTDLPLDVANAAHNGTSWSPERRGYLHLLDYAATMAQVYDGLAKVAKSDEARELLRTELLEFQARYLRAARAYLGASSRVLSSMISGPSNFPVRRQEKRANAQRARLEDLCELPKRARRAIGKKLERVNVREAGGPVGVARADLARLEKRRADMKAANRIVKRKTLTDAEKVAQVVAELGWHEDTARRLLEPNCFGQIGFEGFELTSILGKIKRLQAKIASLEAAEEAPRDGIAFEGGTLEECPEDDRIRFYFDGKPEADVRGVLKSNGFRWSPRNTAWQRQLTEAGRRAAALVLESMTNQ